MSHSSAAVPGGPVAATNGGDASAKVDFWSLALGSIGVVYGDIGTSPSMHCARRFWRRRAQEIARAKPSFSAFCP